MDVSERQKALRRLEEEMIRDDSLPLQESNLVFGEGSPNADVMFIGEAPGFYEDREKRPFVGRAGKLLDKLMEEIGWKREEVYITNIVKRRPPNNRDPEPHEIEAYKKYLPEHIRIIAPKIIVPIGRFAMNYFLPRAQISRDHGKYFWMRDMIVMPMYHTAAALRNPAVLKASRVDFIKLKEVKDRYEELKAERNAAPGTEEKSAEPEVKQTETLF